MKRLLAFMLQLKIDRSCKRKIKKIRRNCVEMKSSDTLEKDYLWLWKKLGKRPPISFFRCLNAISGIHSSLYVPENIQYGVIEPILNNKSYALVFNDKNFFEQYLPRFRNLFPIAVLRGINGVMHDGDFCKIQCHEIEKILNGLEDEDRFILKPAIETGGGSQVQLLIRQRPGFIIDNRMYNNSDFTDLLQTQYKGSFILQKRIQQNPWFEKFNRTSLNTIRLYTYRSVKDEAVHPLHAYVRFGNPGSIVDSSSQGGLTCGVSLDGRLNNFAIERFGRKRRDLEGIKINSGSLVPCFEEMKRIALEIALEYHYHRLLGFDFCVNQYCSVRLLEINTRNIGVINQQMNTGPLYGEYTNEIVEFCLGKPRSIVFDYYI